MKIVFVVIFGIFGYGIQGIAWSWTFAYLFTSIISFYFLEMKVFPVIRSRINKITINKELFRFSTPLVFIGIMAPIIQYTDTIVLGYYLTVVEVGIYNAALPLASTINTFSQGLNVLFTPVATELYATNKIKELESMYKTITKWIFFINFPILLIFLFSSSTIMGTLFGDEYIQGNNTLVVLTCGFFVMALTMCGNKLLIVKKKTNLLVYSMYTAGLVNIGFNIYLVPIFGMIGAAMATFFALLMQSILINYSVRRSFGFSFISLNIIKSIFAGSFSFLMMSAIDFILPINHIAFILLFIVFYTAFLLVFKSIDPNDIEILKAVEKRTGIQVGPIRKLIKKLL